MSLLYHKQNQELSSGVRLIQDVSASNSPMKYTAVKVLEFSADSSYEETLEAFEAGIVVLEGKVTITADNQTFEDVGQRTSIFDEIPTDSVYVSAGLAFGIKAKKAAKILIAYAPTNQTFPVRLIRGIIHQVEHRGKYNNKRLVQNILPENLPWRECQ